MAYIKRTFANIAASQTDSSLVAAIADTPIKVLAITFTAGATATDITFNSKPSGAGTAISALFAQGVRTPHVLPYNPEGWFETTTGQGLSCTTGAGSATGIQITYSVNTI